ncbi:MAG: flagellar brake protein [Gallionella sp.]|nr:flagellar brake protein [Gallionella sp.]MDD4946691.1 flagellar brake protein [Gallionella sp.]MDD5612779.1 flagellar brake protein [Gallionella sp.]
MTGKKNNMDAQLHPVKHIDIQIGKPLAWAVYDKFGRLMMREGAMVESQRQLEGLSLNGLYRDLNDAPVKRTVSTDTAEKPVAPEASQNEDLRSLRLAIGDAIQLQDFSYDKHRFFVKLIGFVERKSVLVSHPMQNDKLVFIKDGEGYQVRGFSGTKTYEFNTTVLGVCLTPYPYLHLTYPAQVKTANMRGAVRIKLRLVCTIETAAGGAKLPAVIEDLSISGARVRADKTFGKEGDKVTVGLRLQIDGENQVFLVPAMIRNVRAEPDSQTGRPAIMHGLEFVQTVSLELTMLQNFVYKSILEK